MAARAESKVIIDQYTRLVIRAQEYLISQIPKSSDEALNTVAKMLAIVESQKSKNQY